MSHRQFTPPGHSDTELRQRTPPTDTAKQRAPIRERQAVSRIPPQPRTSRLCDRNLLIHSSDTAKPHRQVTPSSHSANGHRQAKGANQRAPIRQRQADGRIPPRPRTARRSDRSLLIHSSDSAKSLRQVTSPNHSAKSLRQRTPPTRSRCLSPVTFSLSTTTPREYGCGCRQIGSQRSTGRGTILPFMTGNLQTRRSGPERSSRLTSLVHTRSSKPQHIAVPRRSTPVFQMTCSKREGAPNPGGG